MRNKKEQESVPFSLLSINIKGIAGIHNNSYKCHKEKKKKKKKEAKRALGTLATHNKAKNNALSYSPEIITATQKIITVPLEIFNYRVSSSRLRKPSLRSSCSFLNLATRAASPSAGSSNFWDLSYMFIISSTLTPASHTF